MSTKQVVKSQTKIESEIAADHLSLVFNLDFSWQNRSRSVVSFDTGFKIGKIYLTLCGDGTYSLQELT